MISYVIKVKFSFLDKGVFCVPQAVATERMRLKWLLSALALIALSVAESAHAQCHCGFFLVTSHEWRPDYLAFTTGQTYQVNCSEPLEANEACRRYCEDEVLALNEVFVSQPHIMDDYNPQEDLPCEVLPAYTASFFSACGSAEWQLTAPEVSSSICCHPTSQIPVWCESLPESYLENEEEGRAAGQTVIERKIDTDTDKNAIENNEIEGSSRPTSEEDSESWMTTILKFFGYTSIGELIQNIDIFSLPSKIQSTMKTYNDEISMGQCYMEFTTYNVFRQDGIFANFLRSRRDIEISAADGRATGPLGQNAAIQNLVGGLIGMLEGSPSTRQYADVLKQLMPMVMQVYNADDPTSAITSFISQTLGPFLTQVQTAGAPNPNDIDSSKPGRWPDVRPNTTPAPAPKTTPRPRPRPSAGSSGSSPITSLILQLVKYYLATPGSSGVATSRPTPPPTRAPVSQRPAAPSSSGIASILGLLFGGGQPQSRPKPKPPVVKKPPKPEILEKYDSKSFVEMVLEFIRPVFISIVGKAPGESGVASIREVTRLSSLGRVDDTLVEEVLSPYFCLKNYVVNKAWTLTERGVSSVVGQFTPEEKARMMRMLQEE